MKNKGQALVIILGILAVFMILIPAIIYMVQNESKWTVKTKKSTAAFQVAETGVDRALWKLRENATNWQSIVTGHTIAGYTGTTSYDVYAGSDNTKLLGQYKVTISTGADASKVKVLSIGKDASSNEVRAVEVILTKLSIDSSLSVEGAIEYKPNLIVHWGPVVSYTSIAAPSAANFEYWPRKICKGSIKFRDTDPTPPNSDEIEYWAFQDLGSPPQVDIEYYRDLSKKTVLPDGHSGYYAGDVTIGYHFSNSTSVIFTEGKMRLSNSCFLDIQAAIAISDLEFKAKDATFHATVPPGAGTQYAKVPTYNYPGKGLTTYDISDCGMHGFIFCGGNFSTAGGNAKLCGVADILGSMSFNTFTIFYDPAVAANIKLKSAPIRQVSWKEIVTAW